MAATLTMGMLSGCASMIPPSPYATPEESKKLMVHGVQYSLESREGINSQVKYKSVEKLKIITLEQAKRELWDDEKLKLELSEVEKFGGYFSVIGYEITIGAASDGYLKAQIAQDGKVVIESVMNGVANTPSGYDSRWWNSTILRDHDIDNTKPFEVRMVSTIGKTVDIWAYAPVTNTLTSTSN